MKKKLLVLAISVMFLFCVGFSTITANAEEVTETTTTTKSTTAIEEKSVEDTIAELTAVVNSLKDKEDSEFFNTTILPILLGLAVITFGGIAFLIPWIKKVKAFNKLKEMVQALSTRNSDLQTILNSTDVAQITKSVKNVLGEEVCGKINELYIMYKENKSINEENKAEITLISQQLKSIISAMSIAYSSRSECVAALQTAPEKSVVLNLEKENENLRNYIKEIKGAEAEEIIKNLEV